MSQMVTRKTGPTDDKEKRQADSPVKEMKKKMAANAEKEKQAAAADKSVEKPTDKNVEKNADKATEKNADKGPEKSADKTDKLADKKVDKNAEKKQDTQTEKTKEDSAKGEKSTKNDKQDEKQKKAEKEKAKQNGNAKESRAVHNGVSDVTLSANGGTDDLMNGTVSADSDDDDGLIIDDHDQDELFPELTYDETSDIECFEPPTPENAPSRSLTRRSQSKESKVLKLKEDTLATDRKLRSADSPKPQEVKKSEKTPEQPKKAQEKAQDKTPEQTKKAQEKTQDSPKKPQEKAQDGAKKTQETKNVPEKDSSVKGKEETQKESESVTIELDKDGEKPDVIEVEVDVEATQEESRKLDTNYSKSRVKVSPYRRSMRLADQTNSSVIANYTGNNTTMEMDITETSSFISETEASPARTESPYLSGLRNIRGRRSYKALGELTLKHTANRNRSIPNITVGEQSHRPTGTVVGRKRRPDAVPEPGVAATDVLAPDDDVTAGHSKRLRLIDRIAMPFKRTAPAALTVARDAEIVGINTDLPLTSPVRPRDTFDPESLKPHAPAAPAPVVISAPAARPAIATPAHKDSKKCIIM